jgi:hypothetical protein
MKKRVGLFLIAMVLVAFALALQSAPVEAKCLAPACFASPGCCYFPALYASRVDPAEALKGH